MQLTGWWVPQDGFVLEYHFEATLLFADRMLLTSLVHDAALQRLCKVCRSVFHSSSRIQDRIQAIRAHLQCGQFAQKIIAELRFGL